ncbi:MAG: putative metal-dependent hydrolase [Acidobacteria bacterium]|nr:putative metal-dependent hydrolase [Acidobacteriota bacterium]
MSDDLRYPIGPFVHPGAVSARQRAEFLRAIEETPAGLERAVAGLKDVQLDTPYRDGGWTVRQVIHHLADSHMHSYIRSKFALAENHPTILAYDEKVWASFEDAARAPIEPSLALIRNLHQRWVRWLRSLGEADFARTLYHPENGDMSLDGIAALYAWHGRHHTAQITGLRKRMGW